jgi:hypothetical protein
LAGLVDGFGVLLRRRARITLLCEEVAGWGAACCART